MTVVHETIMDVRSMFNGLDESVLPGLIDGEKRNVSKYDDAILKAWDEHRLLPASWPRNAKASLKKLPRWKRRRPRMSTQPRLGSK